MNCANSTNRLGRCQPLNPNAFRLGKQKLAGACRSDLPDLGLRRVRTLASWFCAGLVLVFVADRSAADLMLLQSMESQASQQDLKPAVEALGRGNIDACRRILKSYADEHPNSVHAEIQLASLMLQGGQTAAAVQVLNAFSLGPADQYEAHFAFARLASSEGRWFDAWAHVQAATQASPPTRWPVETQQQSQVQLKLLEASIALQRNDWGAALEHYTSLRKSAPDNAQVAQGLAIAAFQSGQLELAETTFRAAAQLNVDLSPYPLQLAQLYSAQGDLERAESWYRRALAVAGDANSARPDNSENEMPRSELVSRTQRAFAQWLIGQNRAREALDQLSTPPGESLSEGSLAQRQFLRGLAHRMLGNWATAETTLANLHQAEPANWLISNHLALVLIESEDEGKRARAMQIAQANIQKTQNADTTSTLGWLQFRLGDTARAERTFARLLQTGNISRDTAFYLLQIQTELGKRTEAEWLQTKILDSSGAFFNQNQFANWKRKLEK